MVPTLRLHVERLTVNARSRSEETRLREPIHRGSESWLWLSSRDGAAPPPRPLRLWSLGAPTFDFRSRRRSSSVTRQETSGVISAVLPSRPTTSVWIRSAQLSASDWLSSMAICHTT